MTANESPDTKIRTIRFHTYGEPADVLRLERADMPSPAPDASASPCMPAG